LAPRWSRTGVVTKALPGGRTYEVTFGDEKKLINIARLLPLPENVWRTGPVQRSQQKEPPQKQQREEVVTEHEFYEPTVVMEGPADQWQSPGSARRSPVCATPQQMDPGANMSPAVGGTRTDVRDGTGSPSVNGPKTPEGGWPVERVTKASCRQGTQMYRVKWQGDYPEESWVRVDQFVEKGADRAIEDYWASKSAKFAARWRKDTIDYKPIRPRSG